MSEQVPGQLIVPTSLVTIPVPWPAGVTVSWWVIASKPALTECAVSIVTTQVAVPEHPGILDNYAGENPFKLHTEYVGAFVLVMRP